MASTFATLRADFFARGFDYMNDATVINGTSGLIRTKELFNQEYLLLCEEEKWPFLMGAAAGAGGSLVIADARELESVLDSEGDMVYPLPPYEAAERFGLNVLTAGTTSADFYWMVGNTVFTYPPGATLSVTYYKVPAELVNDADEPLIPNRFRRYIVESMVRVAAREDAPEAAQAAEAERQLGLTVMRRSLLFRTGAPQFQRFTDSLDS